MPYKATGHQASLPCYERPILLPTYTSAHAHARTHTHTHTHTNSRGRAQNELVYDVFYTEFSDSLVPIFKTMCPEVDSASENEYQGFLLG